MSYVDALSFASPYYHIDESGRVSFREDTPEEIKKQFWEMWPAYWKKVVDLERQGYFYSRYPCLPITDEDPNRDQYE